MYGLGSIPRFNYYDIALVQIGLITLFIFTVVWIPESPRWLIWKHNDSQKALDVLKFLRGPQYPKLDEELQGIKSSIQHKRPSLVEVLKGLCCDRSILLPFLTILFIFIFQQLCGGGSTLESYAGVIFYQAGVANPNLMSTYTVGIGLFLTVTVVSFLIVVVRRKVLLSISSFGMFVGTTMLGTQLFITRPSLCLTNSSFSSINVTDPITIEESMPCNIQFSPLAVISVLIIAISFAIGVGPVPFVLLPEYLPLQVRGLAGSVVLAANWSTAAVINGFFLSYCDLVGPWFAWWTFSIINLMGFVVILLSVVETKGKSLEEMQEKFKSYTCFSFSI